MCVAIPGVILEIREGAGLERTAIVDTDGVQREISLGLVPDARVGDHVISHSGFALRVVPADLLQV